MCYWHAGAYTAEIIREGYVTAYVNVIVSHDEQIHYTAITPKLSENEYRFVLTWGSVPSDLDSHLIGVVDETAFHVYYSDKVFTYEGEVIAKLDFDDTTSYGPETVTMTWNSAVGDCIYYVHNFGAAMGSNTLSLSGAKVTVYKGNTLLKVFNVPIGYNGVDWYVFEIKDGKLIAVNEIE